MSLVPEKLPAVASNFNTYCAKCESDRYFKVLTHKTATSAQIQCEVCKSKKTYKIAAVSTGTKVKKAAGAVAIRNKANAHQTLFLALRAKHSNLSPIPYTVKSKFEAGRSIEHPKFGVGYIQTALPEKIEVVFAEATRFLVHNR